MNAPAPSPLNALADLARRDLPDVLADLRRLVELETPSNDKELLDLGLDGIETWLGERLGVPATRVRHDGGAFGDVLDVAYPGTMAREVVLLCHYDTVWPRGTLAWWPVTVDGERFSGPGCFDMKAGIVQGVWALRALRELDLPRPTVRLLLTGDEEIGSPASRPHIERAGTGAAATLVLEPSRDGAAKDRRKGMGLFDVTVHGVEAHAGLDPEAGASAIHALALLVPEITALAAPERGTTVNVGVIAGGTGRNVVAGRATCEVDVRVQDPAEMPRVDAGLAALVAADPRVKIEITGGWNRPPMNPGPASRELLGLAREVAEGLGSSLDAVAVGGASDANFLSALGLPVLDGLGAVGAGPHSRDEHVRIDGTPHQVALVAGLMERIARG
ncbi:M20 family metallopeptidase [Marinactinospora thermotolerans]|uniref:Glutamate carboxypeptidase n=1 Tax=Marinactinospora thermotolerans DSM 45154 TaxID=1122192 RepID=A0A1T4PPX4_9ACTN|nr:M20 family metallopeptidase [Marinactinospora thermotolerans]SJZ93632.1 glutamate carboxypeptidase [Marinactinospora thermotolerans DSM 45154]